MIGPDLLFPVIAGYVLAAASTIALTGWIFWRHRGGPTERALGILVGAIALAVIAFTIRLFAADLSAKLVWELVGYVGLVVLPAAFIVFVLRFTGRHEWVSRPMLAALAVHPAVTLLTLATNPDHGLFYQGATLRGVGDLSLLVWTPANAGPAFWIHLVYSYGLLFLGTVLLLRFALTSNRVYRAQTTAIVGGTLIPLCVNMAVVSGIGPEYVDLTPLGFAIGVMILAIGAFRFQLLDIVPVARRTLIESLDDAVFVLDGENRIVETNPAGRASPCLRPGIDDPVGEPLGSTLRDELAGHQAFESGTTEYTLRIDGDRRHFWARTTPVTRSGVEDTTLLTITEITERRRRERELERTKDLLEKSQETASIGGWEVDFERGTQRWTEEVYRIHGLPLDADVSIEDGIEFYHPEDREVVSAAFDTLLSEGEPYDLELRIVTPAEEVRWVRTIGDPLFGDDGSVVGARGIFQDITERKQNEQDLRESEKSLRDLYRITSDTDLSFEEKLTRILELACDRLGLPFAFLTRIDGDTQQIIEAVGSHDRLQAGASAPISETYCRKTIQHGGLLGVEDASDAGWESDPARDRFDLGCYLGGKIIVDGSLYGTFCVAGDASREYSFTESERAFVELLVQWVSYEIKRDRLEGKLRDLQEAARRLLEAGSIDEIGEIAVDSAEDILGLGVTGIWTYDEKQNALLPITETAGAQELFGSAPRFEPGDSLAWAAFEQGDMAVFEDVSTVEGRYLEDTDVRAEIIVPLGDQGVITTGSPSERKFSETDIGLFELFASTVSSAMLRAEREQALRETRAELKRSNEDLQQFAYVASHDLQEPLRTVSNYLQLLERRYGDELDEDAEEFIEFAVDGAERMHDMIKALLRYSRVDTRDEPLRPTDLGSVYQKTRQNLRVAMDESDATITADELPTVRGDESQLVQLFQNLLDNAITYAGATQPRVHVSAERTDDEWVIAVEDDGIGMSSEKTDQVFQIFERLHSRESYPGTGIGLAMCRKIVERHGGDIWVESESGEGATFFLTLPAVNDDR